MSDVLTGQQFRLSFAQVDAFFAALAPRFRVLAPVRLPGRGRFFKQDSIRYADVTSVREIVHEELRIFRQRKWSSPSRRRSIT